MVIVLFLGFIRPMAAHDPVSKARVFSDSGCQASFRYPDDWVVTEPIPRGATACVFTLYPKDLAELLRTVNNPVLYAISVEIDHHQGEPQVPMCGGELVARHRCEVKEIRGKGWKGWSWSDSARCYYYPHGPYAGLCEFKFIQLYSLDNRYVRFEIGPRASEASEQVVRSFHFAPSNER
jgi:hypothetical protein